MAEEAVEDLGANGETAPSKEQKDEAVVAPTERLYYPSDLAQRVGDGAPYMRIKINERQGTDVVVPYIIGLYVPNNVSISDNFDYAAEQKGMFGAAKDNIMAMVTGNNSTNVTDSDVTATGLQYGTGALAGMNIPFLDQIGKGAQIAAIEMGIAVNPNEITKFNGTQRRSFNFTFKFMSQSAAEAKTVQKIIDAMRTYAYPEVLGSVSLQYPAEFEISFYKNEEQNPFMPIIMPCHLNEFQVTVNPTGNSFHADGAPVEIDMQLGLVEKKALTRNDLYPDFVGKDSENQAIDTANAAVNRGKEFENEGTGNQSTPGGPN